MLQQMRQMKMVVFWFVAITFLVGFVFFGGLDVPKWGSHGNTIAVVNGTKVTGDVYNRYVQQLAETERARFQRDELLSQDWERIEGQAWDGIVEEMLVSQEAKKLGIRVPDDEIVSMLSTNPPPFIQQRFTDDKGQFDAAAYQRAVNDPNYNWAQDEAYLRAVLPSMKLSQMVRARANVSESEVRNEFAHRNQRTKVQYVGVDWPSVDLGAFNPSDSDLRGYYDKHLDRFQRGETVVLEVIRVEKKPSALDEEDAMADARQLLEDEKRGESFAALAEGSSDDPTASRGGDLGWVTSAQLPPEVAPVAAKLEPGQTSEPLRTERGLYIVHADSVRTGAQGREMRLRQIVLHVKPSPETQDSLRTRVIEAAPKAKKDFEGTARALGVTVQKLEPVEKIPGFIPGVGFSKRLVDWAFEAKPGQVSDPVGMEPCIVIARLVEKRDKSARPFDEVRDQVRYGLQEDMKKERARQRLEKVAQRVRAGATLQAAAQAEGLEFKDPAPFNYFENVPGVGSANEFAAVASTLEPGKISNVIEATNGAFVLQVVSREPFDEAAYQKQRQDLYQNLLSQREVEVYQAWIKDLREHADIKDQRPPRV